MVERLETRRLSDALGVEIFGLDLRKELEQSTQEALRKLLDDHYLLLFRGQVLEAGDHIRVLETFGPVTDEKGDGSRHTYVSNVRPDGILGDTPLPFHADYDFRPYIPPVFSLYGSDVAGDSVPTTYAGLAHAYTRLPPDLRRQLEGAVIVNADDFTRNLASADYAKRYSLIKLPVMPPETTHPRAAYPLLRPHPRTGVPLLFVSEMHSSHIEGMDPDSSEAMLQRLLGILLSPENLYSHHWRVGDLVVWDNVAIQHGRRNIGGGKEATRRTLRRVVVSEQTPSQLLGPAYNRPGSFAVKQAIA